MLLRSSPAPTSIVCVEVAKPGLASTRRYLLGDGTPLSENEPSAPIVTDLTTACPVFGMTGPSAPGAGGGTIVLFPAVDPSLTVFSRYSVAPDRSPPDTAPVNVAGTPPMLASRPVAA